MKSTLPVLALGAMTVLGIADANAETLTPDLALARALSSTTAPAKVKSASTQGEAELVYTHETGGQPTVYVFDLGKQAEGYLVVSADDIAPGLLGYSDSQIADAESMNPELRWWIGEYGRQIEWARSTGAASTISIRRNAPDSRSPIDPLVSTRWNQNAPYNNMTPTINGVHTVTGCVATALSQVMKYHNWPPKGVGSNSYTPSSVGQTVTVNFGNTTYDWGNMLDVYDASATTVQKNAVATLMLSAGVAVNMNYTTSESGASSFNAAKAMVNYFDYDKGVTYYDRDYYSLDDWNNLVYDQLANYGPVQYSGQSNDGGHSFVCDGYSNNGYFHINWGWGGMSDGYFLLTALDPGTQGIGGSSSGYNFSQDIIGNVKPNDGTNTVIRPNFVGNQCVITTSNQSSSSVSLGSMAYVSGPFYSYSLGNVTGKYGLKLTDSQGNVTYLGGSTFTNLQPMYGAYGFYVTLPTSLSEGTYTVSPAVCDASGNWYDIPVKVGAPKSKTVTVANKVANFSETTSASITVQNLSTPTPFYIGAKYQINATLVNNSDEEYLGQVRIMLINSSNSAIAQGVVYPVDLMPGESTDINYLSSWYVASGTTLTAGTYKICFVDADGNQISDMKQITLNASSTPTISVSNFTMPGGTKNVPKDKLVFTANLKCVSGFFGNSLRVVIFPYEAGQVTSVASFTTDPIFASAGETKQLTATGDFSDGITGKEYFAMLYSGSSQASGTQLRFTLGDITAADDIEVGDSVIETRYYTINGIEITKTANMPAGLYIVRTTSSDGSVKTSKQLIR